MKKNRKKTVEVPVYLPELEARINAHYRQKMEELTDRMILDILAPESKFITIGFWIAVAVMIIFAAWQFWWRV